MMRSPSLYLVILALLFAGCDKSKSSEDKEPARDAAAITAPADASSAEEAAAIPTPEDFESEVAAEINADNLEEQLEQIEAELGD